MSLSILRCHHSDTCLAQVLLFNLAVLGHAFNKESRATPLICQQMERSCLPATPRCVCVCVSFPATNQPPCHSGVTHKANRFNEGSLGICHL